MIPAINSIEAAALLHHMNIVYLFRASSINPSAQAVWHTNNGAEVTLTFNYSLWFEMYIEYY